MPIGERNNQAILKRNLYIFLGLLVLAIGAYLAYQYWVKSKYSAWEYMPGNAVLILESNQIQLPQPKLKPGQIHLLDLPVARDAGKMLGLIQEVVRDSAAATRFFKDKTVLFSLHPEAKNRLNFIVYIPYHPATDDAFMDVLTQPSVASGLRPFSHVFNNARVTEMYMGTSKEPVFTYILHDNYLILSKSGLLVEDVIRKINRSSSEAVKKFLADERVTPNGKFTKFYLNENNFNDLSNKFLGSGTESLRMVLSLLTKPGEFTFQTSKDQRLISAISSVKTDEATPFYEALATQNPGTIRSTRLIPNNTAILFHLSISNPGKFMEGMDNYLSQNESDLIEQRQDANDEYALNLDSVYYYLKDEVVFCKMETDGVDSTGNLLILPSKNANGLFSLLAYESGKMQLEKKSPQLRENYLNFPLRELDLPLPSMLFGRLFGGFKKCFFTSYGQYLLMADDPQVLKNAITDISINNVWNNSARQLSLLKQLPPAQMSLIVNPSRSWGRLLSSISSRWFAQLDGYESQLREIGDFSIQAICEKDIVKTILNFGKGTPATSDAYLNKLFLQKKVPINKTLARKPFLYKNATTRLYEVMLQTIDNQLIFVQADGKILAKYDIENPLVSDVQPIDYFKNGRTQYIFALPDKLVVFDRKDSLVEFYPSEPFNADLSHFSIFYDEPTRRQKLVVSDLRGSYYTYTKSDKTIKPLNFIKDISHTVVPVQSVNLGGIDYDILLQENGKLHISSALGAEIKNSPFDLQAKFNSPVFIESNAQYSSYVFHAVSRQGEVITVNLKGEVLYRQQLLRPAKDSDFQLLPEQYNNDWLISCATGQTLSIFNKRGETLFQFQNLPPNGYQISYHSFGSDIKFLSLRTGKVTKIYNLSGKQVGDKAIESDFPVSLAYSESYNKLFIYAANKNNLDIWTVKIR